MAEIEIKQDQIAVVGNFLSTTVGFSHTKRDEGTKKTIHYYSDNLIVNLYDNGTLTFQGKNTDGDIAKSVRQFVNPYRKQP